MKRVLLTGFAVLGVASLIIGSTLTNTKYQTTQHTILTILDTVPKTDSPKSVPATRFTADTIPRPDSPAHPGFAAIN